MAHVLTARRVVSSGAIEALLAVHAEKICRDIQHIVDDGANEEDVRQEFSALLKRFLRASGLSVRLRHEYALAGGRVDTKYGGVVLEYKNPNSPDRIQLKTTSAGTRELIKQLKSRFAEFENEEHVEKKRLFGCGTDGRHILFLRHRSSSFEIDEPQPLTPHAVQRLLRALVSLGASGSSFTPQNLCNDFGAESEIARAAVVALYEAISETADIKARTLLSQWEMLFTEVCGYHVTRPNQAVNELAASFGLTSYDTAKFLFALHTYYSIFIKFLGSEIVSAFAAFSASVVRKCINAASSQAMKRVMVTLEKGSNWKAWGVSNFLEGDLFAWYLSAWTDDVAKAVRAIAIKADEYDPSTLSVDPRESQDLLKRLYQNLIPKSVRHDLGEYYTPDWLATYALDMVGYDGDPNRRILDPACGSGTFLVEIINRAKAWFDDHRHECGFSEEGFAQRLLNNVVGFDLNPLAVMTSRVNYLIAIRDLIKHAPHVELPVYLSDSILTPSEFGTLFTEITRLKTAVGEFWIPSEVSCSSDAIAKYTEIMELCIEDEYSADVFVQSCASAGLQTKNTKAHMDLFKKMQRLSAENRNGIWARIIKNSFAPVFAEKFDWVVGNPPWINWQHLPQDYRTDLIGVWKRYGLFTLSGAAAGLGGSKKDLSMLFTYVASDQYLRMNGKLAFLITQSVFKTKGAGDGFRQFSYKDGERTIYLCPKSVDDFSALQVFDGATNSTAMLVLQKSAQKFQYPIPYKIWRGRERRVSQDKSLADVKDSTSTIDAVAFPVIQTATRSPWLTVPSGTHIVVRKILGKSAYKAMAGCTTWMNGVYWVDIKGHKDGKCIIENWHDVGKTKGIEQITARIEENLIFPLIRGEDVRKWDATPSTHIVMPQDPIEREGIPLDEMRRKHPLTFNYFNKFKGLLSGRSGYKKYFKGSGPFYSIYNVSKSTFSPYKVAWRDMGFTIQAAVIANGAGKAIFPEHHVMFIPVQTGEEAHYLCALLNSSPVRLAVAAYTTQTGMSTHVASVIALPRFVSGDKTHRHLADFSRIAHKSVKSKDLEALARAERLIDGEVANLYGFKPADIELIRTSLSRLSS